jgi:hypothetical protein
MKSKYSTEVNKRKPRYIKQFRDDFKIMDSKEMFIITECMNMDLFVPDDRSYIKKVGFVER